VIQQPALTARVLEKAHVAAGIDPAAQGGIAVTQDAVDYGSTHRAEEPSGWAVGLILFAGIMMIMAGTFQAFAGLVAILEDEFYVTTPNYLFQFDATSWGWIHLILGLVVAFAGAAVLAGRTWGRVVGITLAMLSMLANFLFIPYYPFWAILIILLNIFVIWALATHGYNRDV
jgi:hypothetical protein